MENNCFIKNEIVGGGYRDDDRSIGRLDLNDI